ncbi:multicopper oxidase domain-containing protein [Kitasatospora griseola]|uniref:multicopper oxidase domain-containing protein n=1 Tax=Kitasatospora griseola TaxID=2064 RepID=UPI0036D8900B
MAHGGRDRPLNRAGAHSSGADVRTGAPVTGTPTPRPARAPQHPGRLVPDHAGDAGHDSQHGRAGGRFDLNDPTAGAFLFDSGPRKNTAIVKPNHWVVCDFDADNPGRWMVHRHNAYRA